MPVHAQAQPDNGGILRVRGLIVQDQNGHERGRLGAPLPDPMIHGVRRRRVGAISGLSISDADGNERGSYVTGERSGEAFFTLDSEDEQQVLFFANPKGGVNFSLFDSNGNGAQILVFPNGPKLTLTTRRKLKALEESPWAEFQLSLRKLAKMLRPFGMEARSVRIDDRVFRGYGSK